MEMKKLAGGRVIATNPDRLPLPQNADLPKIRVGAPGTAFGNVGLHLQISECSRRAFGVPEPAMVKVIFREIGNQVYLLFGAARASGPDVYELKFESSTTRAPTVRGLKPLFAEAQIALHPDLWYECETEIVQDEDLGYAVAACWTGATTRPRRDPANEVAAGELTD